MNIARLFGAFMRKIRLLKRVRFRLALANQYQPKSNTPKAMMIRAISRKLARKVIALILLRPHSHGVCGRNLF